MGAGYQERDWQIIDYQLYERPGLPRPFRGPDPGRLDDGHFFTCLGAAQTFGCYAEQPFPTLLSGALGFPVFNLGVAGAGPGFFLQRPQFIAEANRSAFVVLQVMSARSVSNSLLESKGKEMLTRRGDTRPLGAAPMYTQLLQELDEPTLRALVLETQQRWVEEMKALLNALTAPTILLWFSTRETDYEPGTRDVHALFGEFPQFVRGWMLEPLVELAGQWVQVISREGLPQVLFNRFSGEPETIRRREDLGGAEKAVNDYYPSPQMHQLAFERLLPACRQWLPEAASRT